MRGVEERLCCKSWEEEVYWKRFSPLPFWLLLRDADDDYRRKIALPKKFSDKMRDKIPEEVGLQGPNGWRFNVKIMRCSDVLYMVDGWEEFVKSYSVGKNDMLFCSYDGKSNIKVLIFEGETYCENELSYFMGKRGQECSMSHCTRKRISTQINDFEVHINHEDNNDEDYVGNVKPEIKFKSKNISGEGGTVTMHMNYDDDVADVKPKSENKSKRSSRNASIEVINDDDDDENEDSFLNMGGGRSRRQGSRTTSNLWHSKGRVITKAEKDAAIAMARNNVDALSFCAVMSSTRFPWRSTLMIPGEWFVKNMPRRNQKVILRVGEKQWITNLHYSGVKGRSVLDEGWNQFVVENQLHEFDVCLLKLVSRSATAVFEVTIFRVGTRS